jgi:hypothetical protein
VKKDRVAKRLPELTIAKDWQLRIPAIFGKL